MNTPDSIKTSTATYEPESNCLRLYVGRVPRDEYDRLRAEGWRATPKQTCDFVATWTPKRRDTALEYADIIEDEDMGPAERAADRAERFSEYRDKRTAEAVGHADRYDAGPSAHGFQNQARAERSAARHDRVATHACDAWSKAEYWQRRTAGVISNALYKSRPDVRMGRIKEIEADIRRMEAEYTPQDSKVSMQENSKGETVAYVWCGQGRAAHWVQQSKLTAIEAGYSEWVTHLKLRLAYEHQMLQDQGSRAAFVEMEVGGWIGSRQIRKVNKSNATGRVVSVTLKIKGDRWGRTNDGFHLRPFNVERLDVSAYRPPTDEDKAALVDTKKAEKAAAPKKDPCPLVNPTCEDAERLQAAWNSVRQTISFTDKEPPKVIRMTQEQYSANSKGTYARFEAVEITGGGFQLKPKRMMSDPDCAVVAKVRAYGGRVVVITDKPQKAFPENVWQDPRPAIIEEIRAKFDVLESACRRGSLSSNMSEEEQGIFHKARIVGLAYCSSLSQFGLTAKGEELRNAMMEVAK